MSSPPPLVLDPTTLLFAISVLGFATAAFAFSSSQAIGGARSGLVEWSQAMLAIGSAFLLLFLRGHAPAFMTYVVANGMLMGVAAFGLLAHTRCFGVAVPRRAIGALVAFGMVGPASVHMWRLPLGVGVFTMSLAIAALLAMTARLIIQHKGLRAWEPSSFAAATIVLLAVACVVRAAASVAGAGTSMSLSADTGPTAWPLVVGMLFVVGATIGFVMMVHNEQRQAELTSSRRDTLTGLHTRAAFFEAVSAVQARLDESYALIVVDIDHFKVINDTHGHAGGDLALAHAGQLILRSIRNLDVAGRFGGDEFCIVLRGCGQTEASRFSERLVLEAGEQKVQLPGGKSLAFTMSAGYATRTAGRDNNAQLESAEQLFERADAALYVAKRSGRKRAIAADESMTSVRAALALTTQPPEILQTAAPI